MSTTMKKFTPHEYTEVGSTCLHCGLTKYDAIHDERGFASEQQGATTMSDTLQEQEDANESWISHFDTHHRKGEPCNQCDNEQPASAAAGESGEWELHEGEDYIVILGGEHDNTENPIARVYTIEHATQIVTEHNSYHSLRQQNERLVEALRDVGLRLYGLQLQCKESLESSKPTNTHEQPG